jgi:hypothetical protein
MRFVGVVAGGVLASACSLLTSLDDLHGGKGDAGEAGSSSIAFVQGRVVHDSDTAKPVWTTSLSLPNIAPHDTIIVAVVVLQSGPAVNDIEFADDQGNSFATVGPITSFDGWMNASIAGAFDVAGSANTIVTVTAKGTKIESSDLYVLEYSGLTANDATSNGTAATQGPDGVVAGAVKLTGSSDLVIGLAYSDGTLSAGTSFTKEFSGGNDASLLEDRITTSSGTFGATATMSASASYGVMVMAAFK